MHHYLDYNQTKFLACCPIVSFAVAAGQLLGKTTSVMKSMNPLVDSTWYGVGTSIE